MEGDVGGALVVGGVQVGVLSWGERCALEGYPGVSTKISHYRGWIQMNTGKSPLEFREGSLLEFREEASSRVP
uniref:Peptidase S1 domain-containing protein n=1 Tax=Timema douglasi TaxID=61478 RepID=A0A7R8ZHU5_TIMDO|nr:unnamed protein product [Timema douglasi]